MAKSKSNVITHGLSGLIGDLLVFRQRANKTVVADRPKPLSKEPSAAQLHIRQRFRKAVLYARTAISDAALKEAYRSVSKPGQSAFNIAFRDYQIAPEFDEEPDLEGYSGAAGQEIAVSVIDDFRVSAVSLKIVKPDNTIVEEGDAVQAENGLDWIYTTTAVNDGLPGSRIIVTARDLPGNRTVMEKILL